MLKLSKGHNSRKRRWLFKKFNQVIYLSSPISWPSFKPLALTVFEIFYWQVKTPKFSKGHNTGKIRWFLKKKINQVIYTSSPINWPSFKSLAQILFEISCWQDFIPIFSKRHNSKKGDKTDKEKKILVSYFSVRNPCMKFQNPCMHGSQDMACIRFHSDFFKGA